MTRMNQRMPEGGGGAGFTALGKIVSLLLILGLLGAGFWVFTKTKNRSEQASKAGGDAKQAADPGEGDGKGGAIEGIVETQTAVPRLDPPGAYQPNGDTIDIELSEYAGYAGLI